MKKQNNKKKCSGKKPSVKNPIKSSQISKILSIQNTNSRSQNQHQIFDHRREYKMNTLRHCQISKIMKKLKVQSFIEYGCSKGQLIHQMARQQKLKLIIGIDINQQLLSQIRLYVQTKDMQYKRTQDQHIYLFKADVRQYNRKLKQFNVELIILTQLIQHLNVQDIPKAMKNVFGFLKPKYCFISTPNRQFNIFFENNKDEFRHKDHKFQWNRQQFKQFCKNIKKLYGYSYKIHGVGKHKSDQSKGFCTQYVLFTKQDQPQKQMEQIQFTQSQIIQVQHFKHTYWRNNIKNILQRCLQSCLKYKNLESIRKIIRFIKNQRIGRFLEEDEIMNKKFIIKHLNLLSDIYQIDQLFIYDKRKRLVQNEQQ